MKSYTVEELIRITSDWLRDADGDCLETFIRTNFPVKDCTYNPETDELEVELEGKTLMGAK